MKSEQQPRESGSVFTSTKLKKHCLKILPDKEQYIQIAIIINQSIWEGLKVDGIVFGALEPVELLSWQ